MIKVAKNMLSKILERPWVAIAAVCLLMGAGSFQGVEMTDEGFWGSFYQQMFSVPHTPQVFEYLYWFTGVVGGAWHCLWPSGGLLGYRLFGILVMCATMVLSASILKPYVSPRVMSLSLLLCGVLQNSAPNIFYEKNWCGFLAVSMAFCLHRGLLRRKGVWLFAAGAVGAVMTFSRIPSVVMLALGASVLFYGCIRAITVRECVVFCSWFAFGSMAGAGALFLVMALLGQTGDFADSIRFMAVLAADSSSDSANHGWRMLLIGLRNVVIIVLGKGFLTAGLVALATAGVFFVRHWFSHSFVKAAGVLGCRIVLVLGILALARFPKDVIAMLACSTGVALLLGMLKPADADPGRRLLCALALGIMALLPQGSDVLLSVVRCALWLALPLAVDVTLRLLRDVRFRVSAETSNPDASGWSIDSQQFSPDIERTLVICFATLLALNTWFWWGGVYRDAGGRLNMRTQVQAPSVRGVLTSSERSAALNEVLSALGRYVKKGDKLLAFDNVPMLHMLTETQPYIGFSWIKLLNAAQFRDALNNAVSKNPSLPVMVAEKRNVGEGSWPSQAQPYLTAPWVVDRYAVLTAFLKTHGYTCSWENDEFIIWTTLRPE